jgi:methionyl aminopeptidase
VAQHLYSERQIALIREAGRIVAECLELIRQAVGPGATTRQIDELVTAHLRKNNATSPFLGYQFPGKAPFPASLCASVNDVVVHGIPDDEELKEGDLVSVDIGACKDGYIGDAAWTFPVGNPDDAAKRLLKAGQDALDAGIGAMKPRGKLDDVSRAIQTLVEARGYSVVREYVGHGVGQSLHEEPQVPNYVPVSAILPVFRPTLKPGMVLAVEPMVNEGEAGVVSVEGEWPVRTVDGGRSVHFEHTVAILKDRIEILTRL